MLVLADTSVWVSHFAKSNAELRALLEQAEVVCHPFVIGELACGNIANRAGILSLLQELPQAQVAEHDEVLRFIEAHRLAGCGLGFIDAHLLASAFLARVCLWTADRQLQQVAAALGVAYS